ncbi:hypothetical protein H8K32_13200 [Undibacterium jejuense]|uniref:Uncharacterized protein n=1 Tax=Undibacterium jejuense TaxID=1344949 RepID=A0A923HEH2_9BURK|nr:hypothetical protein [Undibacterium jejuense]MBC3863062.1 hypothetical protein [Undibacterium jejuense]
MKNLKFALVNVMIMGLVGSLTGCGGTFEGTVGGTVNGLAGSTSVTLLNNGTDSLTVNTNGNFTFAKTMSAGAAYDVTVSTQPINQTCTVTNGAGSISNFNSSNVTNIAVNCTINISSNNYVYGNVTGLASGKTVTLQNNGTDTYKSSGGSFIFPTPLAVGASYNVTVSVQPSGQTCTVSNATGLVGSSTVVQIACQ